MDRPLLATFNLETHESAKNYTRSWTSLDTSTAEEEWFLSNGVCSKPEPTFNWNPTNKPMQITSSGTHSLWYLDSWWHTYSSTYPLRMPRLPQYLEMAQTAQPISACMEYMEKLLQNFHRNSKLLHQLGSWLCRPHQKWEWFSSHDTPATFQLCLDNDKWYCHHPIERRNFPRCLRSTKVWYSS